MGWRLDIYRRKLRASISAFRDELKKDPVKAAAFFISAVAFVCSALSYAAARNSLSISEQALALSQRQYDEERSVVLSATWNDVSGDLQLRPADATFVFFGASMDFPAPLRDYRGQPFSARQDGVMPMAPVSANLRRLMLSSVEVPPNGEDVVYQVSIPVRVICSYAVKGAIRADYSIYTLLFEVKFVGGKSDPPTIKLAEFSLYRRMTVPVSYDELDTAFKHRNGYLWYAAPKTEHKP